MGYWFSTMKSKVIHGFRPLTTGCQVSAREGVFNEHKCIHLEFQNSFSDISCSHHKDTFCPTYILIRLILPIQERGLFYWTTTGFFNKYAPIYPT